MPTHRTRKTLFLLSLTLLAAGLGGTVYTQWPRPQAGLPVIEVDLQGRRYQVDVATTIEQQQKGLMHRERMASNQGMLFIYPKASPMSFWMKNTPLSLDILFFDEQGALVAQHRNVPPCTEDPCPHYPSVKAARYVLEINAGQADAMNLSEGAVLKPTAVRP